MASRHRIFGLLIILFGAGMIATASILLARKFDSVKSGSCCLPATCDVSKLDESIGVATLNRGYGFCDVSAEQATTMGCPGAHLALTTQCSLSNSHLCSTDANKMFVLVAGILGILAGVCLLVLGGGLMLGVKPSFGKGNFMFLVFCTSCAVILSIICLVFASIFFHHVSATPFSSVEATKCTKHSHSSHGKHHHSSSRCLRYEHSIFEGDTCPYVDQRAHVLSWMLHADRLKSVTAAMVALPSVLIFAALVALVLLICRLCCDCGPRLGTHSDYQYVN